MLFRHFWSYTLKCQMIMIDMHEIIPKLLSKNSVPYINLHPSVQSARHAALTPWGTLCEPNMEYKHNLSITSYKSASRDRMSQVSFSFSNYKSPYTQPLVNTLVFNSNDEGLLQLAFFQNEGLTMLSVINMSFVWERLSKWIHTMTPLIRHY